MRTLIKNLDWIITVDRDRRMIRDGAIAIIDDRIEAIEKTSALARSFGADEVMDAEGRIALPGFVDCSVSNVHHLGRGLGDACDYPIFRLDRSLVYEAALGPEDALWAARACQLEMIRSGTTSFVDAGCRHCAEVTTAAEESGLRATVSRACYDVYDTFLGDFPEAFARESLDETIDAAETAIGEIRGRTNDRIGAGVAVPWLVACSDALLSAVADLAKRSDAKVIVGAGRARDDAVASRREHGRTEVVRLDEAGLLGARTILASGGWTSPRDMVVLTRTGTAVACCPSESHRLGTGSLEFGRYPELLEFGARVVFGSGSAMASNFTDILRQIFLFCGGNKSLRLDATVATPESAVEMATIGGAAAIGIASEVGSLEAGKKADIAIFDTIATDWIPLLNPLANLTFSTRGGADTVIVNGRVLMANGTVRTLDEARVLQECQVRAEALAARTGLSDHARPGWEVS